MTEELLPPHAPPPSAAVGRLLPLLLVAAVIAAAGAGGWWLWQLQQQRSAAVQSELSRVQARLDGFDALQHNLLEDSQRIALQIASFDSRLEGYDEMSGKLAEQLQGGRVRFQLAAIENLLLSANERVQLHRDVRGALTALELAEQRLVTLSEPRLFKLREAIAAERSALLAVAQPDLTSAALTLSSLIARVPQLSLRARVPERPDLRPVHVAVAADAGWVERAWARTVEALASVFSLRRNEGPSPRLLPVQQEALVYQTLALKLEGARVAMLRGDAVSLRDLCDSALGWLGDYFRADDPQVLAARAELERLKAIQLDPPLPDITRSLLLLRGYLDSAVQ